ncbi:helix-turn-helix domain-containing protein [Thermomonospora amylolytica]|uniref:helix-turn-helix domain-containing protein n=1 Tax=Thermomonospora amylolytica TaxID=1411117 RepID=UPI0018E4FAB2|nr:helix-turn-helix transcriptional regulator [Thermomonospora amylolytica]
MFGAPEVPGWFWDSSQLRQALASRHMGKVVRAFRTHPYHGRPISQSVAAGWLYLTQSQLSRIENGPPVQDLDRLIQWAHTLRIPADLLWFSLPDEDTSEDETEATTPASPAGLLPEDDEWRSMTELLRRTFLKRGLAAVTLPALGLDELKHIAAALSDARRYADHEVATHFQRQLADCAANDRTRGPKQSIPIALGLVAAIEKTAGDAKPAIRRSLLRVGAQVAEFLGWLYRDIAMPELAGYWRDRAVEWAQAAGDFPMQGYVLLKKSQAAWDERDALRMLTLAEASQEGPWSLPPRVRAEALQQEARGHAMLDGDLSVIESKLEDARELLDQDKEASGIAAHYDKALFGLQVAICYNEAGQPDRALGLYEEWLSPRTFSRRDYGYFLSLKSEALVSARAPDDAADTGLEALALARETCSARTHQEVLRLVGRLRPWKNRESVRELREAVLHSTG